MATPVIETTSVTVERVIDATPERLYAAFTSRDELNNWFCNNSFIQTHEGGRYLFVWTTEDYSATGQVKKIVENEKLVFSWRSTWQGEESDYAETFKVKFEEADDGTKVTLIHKGMPEDGKEGYEYQWNKRLDDLKQYVETGGVPNIVNRVIIGIFPGAVSNERAEELGLEQGLFSRVANLVPDLGAEKAGIQIGDIITHMNGEAVTTQNNMSMLVQDNKPGDEVEVKLVRGDEKMTLAMPLTAYPVPPIPSSYEELADNTASQYDALMGSLREVFDGVSEADADKRPAEGEWSAKLTMAHLIYSERRVQEQIGGRIANGQPRHWSGNSDARLQAIVATNPTIEDLLSALKREQDETLALMRHFPEDIQQANKNHLWSDGFGLSSWVQHTQSHIPQITEAIEAASAVTGDE